MRGWIAALVALELEKRGHHSILVRTHMMAAIISTTDSRPIVAPMA